MTRFAAIAPGIAVPLGKERPAPTRPDRSLREFEERIRLDVQRRQALLDMLDNAGRRGEAK